MSQYIERTKLILVGVLTIGGALAVQGIIALVGPVDNSISLDIVSGPLALLVLDLGMLIMFRMSQKRKPDGTYIWNGRTRYTFRVGCWIMVAMTIIAVFVLVYKQASS